MKKNIIIIVLSLFIITAGILALRFLFGENEDAWICENGEWVKHGNPSAEKPNMPCGEDKKNEPDNKEEEEENEEKNITVDAPSAGETVNFPFKISGRAGVFENIVRVELREKEGEELYEGIAYANSPDIGQFGPFEKEINFLTKEPEGEDVILDVFWDSPKDGSRLDNVSMPLKLAVGETSSVKVYFNREEFDSQNSCDKVGYVERIIPKTKAPARAAIELLLEGPTEKEFKNYYITNINQGVKINGLNIKDGAAYVDFDKTLDQNVAGSCRVIAIRAEITQTLKQFPNVNDVIISIDGRTEDILQP